MLRRILTSLAGLVGLTAALVGIPAGLYAAVGNPLPSTWSLDAVLDTLRRPDDGTLFITIVAWVGWVAWAVFALAVVIELVGQLSGRRIRLPGLRRPQLVAAPLVAMLLAVAVAAPAVLTPVQAAAQPTDPPPAPPTAAAVDRDAGKASGADAGGRTAEARTAAPVAAPGEDTGSRDVQYRVKDGDSLWRIADRFYGDGNAWSTIARANQDLVGERGENYLEEGWRLRLPDVPTDRANTAGNSRIDRDANPGDTYRVEKGDTLSGIADEAYADTQQWPRIYQANRDQISDPDLIDVGQRLDLPAERDDPRPDRVDDTDRSQERRAGTEQAQPDRVEPKPEAGQPAAEQPVPTRPGQPAATEPAPPTTRPAPPQASAPAEPARHLPTSAAAAGPEQAAPTTAGHDINPALVAGPASALLAAGILGLIAARRRSRAISRRPGRRVPALTDDAHQAVTALRHIAAPFTVAHLDRALRTLSAGLALQQRPLPALTAVRLDDDRLDCRLATADTTPPPKPFTADDDGTIWTLTADRADAVLDADQANQVAAPYPSLVTLGQDADGAHLLVDLETIACLRVTTPTTDDTDAVLAALAFELATSSWADDLTLTLVGSCPELPAALGVDRARHLNHFDDLIRSLEADAADSRQLLDADGLPEARQGRAEPGGADAWTPHIVLIGHPLADADADRLATVLTDLPRVAVAAVTTGRTRQLTGWELTTQTGAAEATLAPLGLTLTPQRLTGDAYRAVCEALQQSQSHDTEPAPWWNHDPAAHRPDQPTATGVEPADSHTAGDIEAGEAVRHPGGAVVALAPTNGWEPAAAALPAVADPHPDPDPDGDVDDDADGPAVTTDDTTIPPVVTAEDSPSEPTAPDGQVADADHGAPQPAPAVTATVTVAEAAPTEPPAGDRGSEDRAGGQLVALHRPTLLLLGDVDLVNVDGEVSRHRNAAELHEPIAYIHLNPGTSTRAFSNAMADRMSQRHVDALASRARRYLGTAPDGAPLFPPASRRDGYRYYDLHEWFYSDWRHYCSLVDGGVNTASTAALTDALRLVRGRPLASVADGLWRWSDDWREEATAVIVDTAHELAERAIARSDVDTARWAVGQGRKVDSITEALARDELRLERLAGNHAKVQRIAQRIIHVAKRNSVPPDAETVELLHAIRDGERRRAQ